MLSLSGPKCAVLCGGGAAPAHRPALIAGPDDPLPTSAGLRAIKALLEEASIGARIIRSELEERFQDFLIRIGLPLPQTNVVIEGYEVDCVWREQRLIVELDGHATHSPTYAF